MQNTETTLLESERLNQKILFLPVVAFVLALFILSVTLHLLDRLNTQLVVPSVARYDRNNISTYFFKMSAKLVNVAILPPGANFLWPYLLVLEIAEEWSL